MKYIHGTNSTIFAFLDKTNLEIQSLIMMLQQHFMAPMSGELGKEGAHLFVEVSEDKDLTPEYFSPAFSYLYAEESHPFNLDKIIKNYSQIPAEKSYRHQYNFQNEAKQVLSRSFSNIFLVIVYLVRARQSGCSLRDLNVSRFNILELGELVKEFYRFLQLFGLYIFPNPKEGEKITDTVAFSKLLSGQLNFEMLINKIKNTGISMTDVLKSPTPANLAKVIAILQLPDKRQFFGTEKADDSTWECLDKVHHAFCFLSSNSVSSYQINDFLFRYVLKSSKHKFFEGIGRLAKQYIAMIDQALMLLQKILDAPDASFKLSAEQKAFLDPNNVFPVILLAEPETQMERVNYEFRSKKPLQIGVDIKMIATDTLVHQYIILNFLAKRKLYHVKVVLFDQLKQAKIDRKEISDQYHHTDGFPKLSWLASLAVPKTEEPQPYRNILKCLIA